jgi:hypothetical protein
LPEALAPEFNPSKLIETSGIARSGRSQAGRRMAKIEPLAAASLGADQWQLLYCGLGQ